MSRMPRIYVLAGLPLVLLSAALAGRMIWEQTVVTWAAGPQQIALAILSSGLGSVLYFALYGGLFWLAAYLIAAISYRSLGGVTGAACLIVYAASWGIAHTPYGFWQRQFVDRLASGGHAASFAMYAAANGDVATLEALVAHGVPPDARAADGGTPLHAAAAAGELPAVEFLVGKGADVNARNERGDPPLAHALAAHRDAVAHYLAQHGAQPAEPSPELRAKMSGGGSHRPAATH